MSICYTPLIAYRDEYHNITFNANQGIGESFELPCGKCMGCRLENSRQWAIRCVHEAKYHKENCFITMTYNDNELPENNSLCLDHIQEFWRKLRKSIYPKKIKIFYCGEYGLKKQRPHYHGIVFGHDFGLSESKQPRFYHTAAMKNFLGSPSEDEKLKILDLYKDTEYGKLYKSENLEKIWKKGFCTVAEMSFETAAYVARYVTKKVNGYQKEEHYGDRVPEFGHMSRNEGIGKRWIEEYYKEVFCHNNIIHDGRMLKIPRYYEKWFEKYHPQEYEEFKIKRESFVKPKEETKRKIDQLICQAKRFRELTRSDEREEKINSYDDNVIQYYRRKIL